MRNQENPQRLNATPHRGAGPPWLTRVAAVWIGVMLLFPTLANAQGFFLRGDANLDGRVNIGDAYVFLNFQFGSQDILCEDAADANDDGLLNIADALYLLGYLFQGGAAPPGPFPRPGNDPTDDDLGCAMNISTGDPELIVAVNRPSVLSGFTFEAVVQQIIDTGPPSNLSPLLFYNFWWRQVGSLCLDTLNGFPNGCGRAEATLEDNDPFTDPMSEDAYEVAAVFNRFDLAPPDGSDCGEYRVVFGKRSGLTDIHNRNMINFEAVVPNPDPAAGLDGCTPILEVWDSLDSFSSDAARAAALEGLFFDGIPAEGVPPIIHADHFLPGAGQIRTNTRMASGESWALREWNLNPACGGAVCFVYPNQVTVNRNPAPELFATSSDPIAVEFQADFIDRVGTLIVEPAAFWTEDETLAAFSSVEPSNDYRVAIEGNLTFDAAIQDELDALGSDLTPEDIVARATSESCAGCHTLTANDSLGGGLWGPSSLGAIHVSESGGLSSGLMERWLPEREDLVRSYLP